jgi:hypothetical protein
VAKQGFATKSGRKLKVVLELTKRGAKLLRQKKHLKLVATVVTRNHQLQRVTSRAKRP